MLRRVLLGSVLVTALFAIGVAWATIPSDGGTINACYGKLTGIVRIIDGDSTKCQKWENPIAWSQNGVVNAYYTEGGAAPQGDSLMSLDLPSGHWTLTATINVFSGTPDGQTIQCRISPDGGTGGWSEQTVAAYPATVTMPLVAAIDLSGPSPERVYATCRSAGGGPLPAGVKFGHRQMTAIPVTSLTYQAWPPAT